jgi:hypothetical protein
MRSYHPDLEDLMNLLPHYYLVVVGTEDVGWIELRVH